MKKLILAADAVKMDPARYTVDFENDKVRVVRIRYGPHERSVMHDHAEGVLVFLTDQRVSFTYPDGKTEEVTTKAGETMWEPGVTHLPENLTDEPLELILVEIKG
jgi:uncharacterized RmlC-like cupin family protein